MKINPSNLTIIYYTSNREEENFENKIKQKLLEVAGNIPIISVSQKPIDLGKNICVGEHYVSNLTLYRQLLIGCKAAKTQFVINAESDFLYPPEYFSFVPTDQNKIYRYNNIRLMYKWHWGFFRKKYSEGAQIAGRNHLISILENSLKDTPEWYEKESLEYRKISPYKHMTFEFFGGENACITFKTGEALHKFTAVERERSKDTLPYWGTSTNMRLEMFGF